MNTFYVSNKLSRTIEFLKHFSSHCKFSVSASRLRALVACLKWNRVYRVGYGTQYIQNTYIYNIVTEIYPNNKVHSNIYLCT
jgi:hypothetical protein